MRRVAQVRIPWASAGLLSIIVVGAAAGRAWSQPGAVNPVDYVLGGNSAYEVGCFGPCECAVQALSLTGGFRLRKTLVDPLFTHYAVEDFRASFVRNGQPVPVTGSGEYRIGGEVALVHQLVLDLVVDGASVRRFDSGTVSGGATFPAIDISVAANAFACHDTVIAVHAKPTTAGVPIPPGSELTLRVVPNPFRADAEIRFALEAPALVDARVFDGNGREVRSIAQATRFEAGPQALSWDGRATDGSRAKSGIYFVRVRAAGREWVERVAKLE
jgi:hypothetical protein